MGDPEDADGSSSSRQERSSSGERRFARGYRLADILICTRCGSRHTGWHTHPDLPFNSPKRNLCDACSAAEANGQQHHQLWVTDGGASTYMGKARVVDDDAWGACKHCGGRASDHPAGEHLPVTVCLGRPFAAAAKAALNMVERATGR